jgi:hypothetical protein
MGSVRRLGVVAAVVVLGVVCGCKVGSSAADPANPPVDNGAIPKNAITGTVTFKGSPLAGVTITLFLTNENTVAQTTTTDANGNYIFAGVADTGDVLPEFQFWAQKTGYGFYPNLSSGGGGGAKVMRWDYTGQFQGNGVTDAGIYFTVIDFISSPRAPLTGANFTAYDGSNPVVQLAATGQRTSYAAGDDGAEQKGVAWAASAGRFTDHQDGSVTDTVTGLIWLKDATCLPATNWAAAIQEANGLAAGACGLADGSKAGDWRR